jgi:hypothetical protein
MIQTSEEWVWLTVVLLISILILLSTLELTI